jgi:hypothetical protein
MQLRSKIPASVLFCLISLATTGSFAGRPLTVDDADVNAKGSGHVEIFYERGVGGTQSWTISPAYGIFDGVEIAAAFNRDNTADVNTATIQAKIRLTESKKDGCNFATSFGLAQPNTSGVGSSQFINGLISCNMDDKGSVHLNLGLVRPPVGANVGNWGIAYEREFGAVTGHIELFGQENAQPTLQLGLRSRITKTIQLDGTVGSTNGESTYSVGLTFLF